MSDVAASDQPPAASPPPEAPSVELARLKQQAEEYLQGWQRAKADYLNLKKQTEKERAEIVQFANAALILELLPIYDHFKRAVQHIPDDAKQQDWVKGILHIQTQFKTLFTALGLEEIQAEGAAFDPNLHEAVAKERRDGALANRVLEEVSTGFQYRGKVLVPAKVKVSA